MPTQAVQTEEENLIILDDIVEDNTSPEIKIEETVPSEEIIDFWSNEENFTEEKKVENLKEEKNVETSKIDSDTWFDLWDFWTDISTEIEEPIIEEKKEEVALEETSTDLGFWSFWDDTSIKSDISTKDDSSDLNSILDETIVKLQSRADIIAEDKSVEQSNIKGFKSHISDLESNVMASETIVSDLNKESSKIRSNIKSLERMKLKDEIAETKKETSAKIHNTKRVRK